jgi:hypothetical protein
MSTLSGQTKQLTRKWTKAAKLSLIAGVLILCNSALVGAAADLLPGLLPTLPGSSGNDPTLLYMLSVVGITCGVLVLFEAAMLYLKPVNRKVWGILVAVSSVPSLICGGGFIVGLLLAVFGGKTALTMQKASSQN